MVGASSATDMQAADWPIDTRRARGRLQVVELCDAKKVFTERVMCLQLCVRPEVDSIDSSDRRTEDKVILVRVEIIPNS